MPFVAPSEFEKKEVFKYISTVKRTISPRELLKGIDDSDNLLTFTKEIFALKYDEKPNYLKLQGHLLKCLDHLVCKNDYEFDWNQVWAQHTSKNINYRGKKPEMPIKEQKIENKKSGQHVDSDEANARFDSDENEKGKNLREMP